MRKPRPPGSPAVATFLGELEGLPIGGGDALQAGAGDVLVDGCGDLDELGEDALDAMSQHPVVGQRRLARRIDVGEIVE
ncbi:MAG TPA: hypothetical protein VFW64_11925 [Pseudonocardiaceae bacterium]|nr:hypothetical protein [Pseudonocardiaceae bacterium]